MPKQEHTAEELVERTRRLAAFAKASGYNEKMAAQKAERRIRRDGGQMRLFYNDTELDRRHPEEW